MRNRKREGKRVGKEAGDKEEKRKDEVGQRGEAVEQSLVYEKKMLRVSGGKGLRDCGDDRVPN